MNIIEGYNGESKGLLTKSVLITVLFVFKASTVLANHQSQQTTGSGPSLATQDTLQETALYLFVPFLLFVFFLNEAAQFYLRRKYSETSLKSAEDYRGYSIIASSVLVFILAFSRVFHDLPHVSTEVFAAILIAPVLLGLTMKYWEQINSKLGREE